MIGIKKRRAAHVRLGQTGLHGLACRCLHPVRGFTQAAKPGEMVDPLHERHHDQGNDEDGGHEEDDPPPFGVQAHLQHDQPDDTEQERADEVGQHGLGQRVFDQQAGGTGRCGVGGRAIGRNHDAQREGRDGQHAGSQDAQQTVHRLAADLA